MDGLIQSHGGWGGGGSKLNRGGGGLRQTAGFGPCFHLPGQAILEFRFFEPQPNGDWPHPDPEVASKITFGKGRNCLCNASHNSSPITGLRFHYLQYSRWACSKCGSVRNLLRLPVCNICDRGRVASRMQNRSCSTFYLNILSPNHGWAT